MPSEPVLAPLGQRVKTDMRLPASLVAEVREISAELGIPMNAFFALSGALLCAQMAHLKKTGRKRTQLVAQLEKIATIVIKGAWAS